MLDKRFTKRRKKKIKRRFVKFFRRFSIVEAAFYFDEAMEEFCGIMYGRRVFEQVLFCTFA